MGVSGKCASYFSAFWGGYSLAHLWEKFDLRTWIMSPRTSALKSTCLVLSSTYVDRGRGIRLRSFFSRRIRLFPIVICGCKSYRSARAAVPKVYCSPRAEGVGRLRRRGAARGRRPHRPRHWSGSRSPHGAGYPRVHCPWQRLCRPARSSRGRCSCHRWR